MVFIQKNASLFLLFLLVLAGFGLVASAVFFQISINNLNKEYSTKGRALIGITSEIQEKQSTLSLINEEIQLKSEMIEDLQMRYAQVKKQNEDLLERIQFLSNKISEANKDVNLMQNKLSVCEANNAQWEAAYDSLMLQRDYYASLAGTAQPR
ncbi:hypothetical protein HYV79_01120 [Candidatus Woesearchaeota archaeon]|nr:hypothetical protein [Candidatus Woesearchaeota archaeon]